MIVVLKWVILLLFLCSMNIWFSPYFSSQLLNLLLIILLCFYNKTHSDRQHRKVAKIVFVWIIFYAVFLLLTGNTRYAFSQPFFYLPAVLLCSINNSDLQCIYHFVVKVMAYILSIGFIIFLIDLIVDLPFISYVTIGEYYPFENYIFLIKSQSLREFFRFSGPFSESGHMSMICAFLLYANKYNLKQWYNIVFLISVLFSLSLAGYVLLGLGLLLYSVKSIKMVIGVLLMGFTIFISVTQLWNNGDNPVNEAIFSRLEYDKDKGISGNNRFSYDTDKYYENLSLTELLFGVGLKEYNRQRDIGTIDGAGYKLFVIINGILGCFFVFMIYYSITLLTNNRRYAVGFLILMIASFMQRAYPTWMAWLLPFISGIVMSSDNKIVHEKGKPQL